MDQYTQQLVNELRDASRDKVPMSVELCGQSAVRLERLAREVEELKEKLAERSWAGAGLLGAAEMAIALSSGYTDKWNGNGLF